MSLPDWINADTVSAFAQVVASITTVALVWLATRQMRSIRDERLDRWLPVLTTILQPTLHDVAQLEIRNLGPGPALSITIFGESLSEDCNVDFEEVGGTLALAASETIRTLIKYDGMGAYLTKQIEMVESVPLAKFRVEFKDALGNPYSLDGLVKFVRADRQFPLQLTISDSQRK